MRTMLPLSIVAPAREPPTAGVVTGRSLMRMLTVRAEPRDIALAPVGGGRPADEQGTHALVR